MQCYAPLLVNVNPGARQWRPNLIGYDTTQCFGSPSYYAMSMFGQNTGDEVLKATIDDPAIYYSVTRDSRHTAMVIKLVNAQAVPKQIKLDIKGVRVKQTGTATTLAAAPEATNSIYNPTNVVPVMSKVTNIKPVFNYKLPADSITVLRLNIRDVME
jgi:alpha-L-arabinofuranosidase